VLENISWATWLVVLLVLAVVVAVVSAWLGRERRSVWQQFAEIEHLTYHEAGPAGGPSVEGIMEGRRISLHMLDTSSDTGALGVQSVRLAVQLMGPVPAGLRVTQGGLIGQAEKALVGDAVETGDPDFDRLMVLHADDPAQLRAWLTPFRKGALRRLVALDATATTGIEHGEVYYEARQMRSTLGELRQQCRDLLALALTLDFEPAQLAGDASLPPPPTG